MAQRAFRRARGAGGARRRSRAPASPGFAWELKPDRLSIVHAGRPLTDYVFSDPEVLRPHFQNLRAPSGVQVTRTHPPAAGDATDHATMHPGVWLAFGDINGEDFWRNKARIEHVAFTADPAARGGPAHVCDAKPARCRGRHAARHPDLAFCDRPPGRSRVPADLGGRDSRRGTGARVRRPGGDGARRAHGHGA